MNGWMSGWMGRWMDGWMKGTAGRSYGGEKEDQNIFELNIEVLIYLDWGLFLN